MGNQSVTKNQTGSVSALDDDRSPGLREFEQVPPAGQRGSFGGAGIDRIRFQYRKASSAALSPQAADAPGAEVELSPHYQPQESQHSGNDESDTPPPSQIDRQDDELRNRTTDRRSAVEERRSQPAFALREPFRHGFGRAGQLADSPNPSGNRNPAKLMKPIATDVSIETREYQRTEIVSPRRVPTRSICRPQTVCPIE